VKLGQLPLDKGCKGAHLNLQAATHTPNDMVTTKPTAYLPAPSRDQCMAMVTNQPVHVAEINPACGLLERERITYLEAWQVGCICVMVHNLADQHSQQPEGGLWLPPSGDKQQGTDKVQALAVAHCRVVHREGSQHIRQRCLPPLRAEPCMLWEGAWQVLQGGLLCEHLAMVS
jgi:hypothetical protein